MNTNLPTIDDRWNVAVAALAAVERVTVDDVQRVADALSLDLLELLPAVMAERKDAGQTSLRDVIAAISEIVDGDAALSPVQKVRMVRTIVRQYERDTLGIVTAPDEAGDQS